MGKVRVLIVEGELVQGRELRSRLVARGYEVLPVAMSAEEAIGQVKETQPDLALIDIKLCGETAGIEAAEQIRSRFGVPVVYVAACADEKMLQQPRVSASLGYILKPFDMRQVHGAIQMALYTHEIEKQLQESEAKLAAVAKASPDYIMLLDTDLNLQYLNHPGPGRTLDEVLGKPVYALTDEPVQSDVRRQLEAVLATGRPTQCETVYERSDGMYMTFESRAAIVRVDDRVLGVVVVSRDITDRVRAEQALRTSHRLLSVGNRYRKLGPLLDVAVAEIRELTKCEAVGIRVLDEGGCIAHQAYEGFPPEFYEVQDPLSAKFDRSECIEVIQGDTDPALPFYSAGGSFFVNAYSRFLATLSEREQAKMCTLCRAFGYESIALVPIDADGRMLGLIHVADPRENRVPPELIEILEPAASHLGANIVRIMAEDALWGSLQVTARGERTLLALGQAAQAVQRAHTRVEVYRTIGEQILELGYDVTIWELTEDRVHLALAYTTLASKRIRQVEELTGLSAQGYRFALEPGSHYHQVLLEGRVMLSDPIKDSFADALPLSVRPLADQAADMLGVERAIYAPLKVGEESLGLMVVIGASLSEVDIPAVTVFVNQAAIALENAQLFEKVHAGRERLKVLSRQLVDAQETVRRRVAHELHDQIGQILTGLSLLLGVSEQAPVDLLGSRLREAQDLVEELMSRVDQMSLDLRPAMLDDLGLLHALVWHIERYSSHTGVKVALEHSGMDRRFPSQVETAAYRIVQEGLTNVARHSSASKATVRLWCDEGTLHVQVDDQGVGFDLTMASEAGGLGGMKERSALLGGKMAVESIPGEGTRVTAELPIDGVEGEEG